MNTWPHNLIDRLADQDWPHGVTRIVVHCSATPPEWDGDIRQIHEWHQKRGWTMVGYHHVITRPGEVQNGRPYHKRGAHVKGYNHNSLGICLIGGITDWDTKQPQDNFTPEQKATLKAVLTSLKVLAPQALIQGHYELDSGKACPSFDVGLWCEASGVQWRSV